MSVEKETLVRDADLVAAVSAEMRPRRDAYLLGAGFSITVGSGVMPSTMELGRRVIELASRFHMQSISTHSSMCDGLSCDWPQLVDGAPPMPFEVWLGHLADTVPYRTDAFNARARSLYLDLLDWTEFEIRTSTLSTIQSSDWTTSWITKLVRAWHDGQAGVISFNYDTIIEAGLASAQIPWPGVDGATLSFRCLGPSIVPAWQAMMGGDRLAPMDTFRLFKLHGSIHWYWDEVTRSSDSIVDIGLPETWQEDGADDRRFRSRGLAPLLVPPLTSKANYLSNSTLRELWRLAYEDLRVAERLIVIGYSLPEYDLLVTSLLRDVCMFRSIPVVVVDVAAGVGDRLRALGFADVDESYVGPDAVERFVADL